MQEILFNNLEYKGIRDKENQMPEMQEYQGEAADHSLSGGDFQEELVDNLGRFVSRKEEKR